MLTEEQVQRLFEFCVKHHVHHYDVQVELVDHLANAIEEKMSADPKLDFDAALASVYASFGILGFSQVVNANAESLAKKYRREKWKLFFSYFSWPKIALTTLFFVVSLLPLQFFPFKDLGWVPTIATLLVFGYEIYVFVTLNSLRKKQIKKLQI